jgi:hypothetical protein
VGRDDPGLSHGVSNDQVPRLAIGLLFDFRGLDLEVEAERFEQRSALRGT